MTKVMQTKETNLPTKEVQGQRVVSYKQIAELHQIDTNNLQRNFNRNKSRFIERVDYFLIRELNSGMDNLSTLKYYFTESGYLMLVKSLTDDLSWEVQRMLVNSYFRASMLEQVLSFLPEAMQKVVYYRTLGLTQRETGKLMGMSKDSIQAAEKKLKGLGYKAPNLSGKRNSWSLPGLDSRLRGNDKGVSRYNLEQMEVEL